MKALDIKDLRKTYKNGHQALKGIDLHVEEGDFFALLGPNGAGKSTTIGIITSLVNKSDGHISVFGHDIETEREQAKSCIGLVPQEINFSQFEQVQEIVVNQAGYYGIERSLARRRAKEYIQQLGLWDKRHDRSRTLSGGLKRRLMIARALVHHPKLLILDEPTAGVDIELRRSMWRFLEEINANGTTIILTTHYLEEAERLCRNIAIIDDGLIIKDTTMKDLLAQLNMECFIMDMRQPLPALPKINGYRAKLLDETTLEIEVNKGQSLNDLFSRLSELGVEIISMRNKANRLEELFIRLLDNNGGNPE